ncbi:hypothetical protein [Nocardia stercoris]|uniref:Uncharacterized protein n=1 Tax=Nocardia stercoris TaxID=2483361 RepID=A0A3M2KZL9_9NOCA|nr:hypothetical protein [Nocardia stercoris]RMI29900.1 hypothetical protein EBN03_24215 [Nocardia stercoris]
MGDSTRDPDDEQPDLIFPFFSLGEARQFRASAYRVLVELGGRVSEVGPDFMTIDRDRFILHNIAVRCREADPRNWRTLLRKHFRTVMAADLADGLALEERLATVYPRIMPAEALALTPVAAGSYGYAPVLVDGLRIVLAFDRPDIVVSIPEATIPELGVPERVWARAMDNLRAVPVPAHETFGRDGGWFHATVDPLFFHATRVLILDEVLTRLRIPFTADGILVSLPNRHELLFRPIDGSHFAPAVYALADFTVHRFGAAVGPLSPHLYWWRNGNLTRLTELRDGALGFELPDELVELMDRYRA